MGALVAQGCECGGQGQSSESTGDEIQPMTHRLQHFLLCPTPALVQNMKLESSVAPTAWFWARGVVHLVETCMNDTKIIETMKTYCAQGEFLCPFYHHLQHLSFSSVSEHLFAPFTLWLCTTFLFRTLISSKPI